MTTDEYVPSLEALLDHYEELSLTVSGDPEVAKENRRIAEKSLARVRREAARSALDGLAMEAAGVAAAANRGKPWVARTVQGWARDYRDTHYPEETP